MRWFACLLIVLSPTLLAAFTSDHGEAKKVPESESVKSAPIEASAPLRRAEPRAAVLRLDAPQLDRHTSGVLPTNESEEESTSALPADHDSEATR